jgi:peptide chain release factor 2
MEQLKKQLLELQQSVAQAAKSLDLDNLKVELNGLRGQMAKPDFWSDNSKAQDLSKREAGLAKRIEPWLNLRKEIGELLELAELNDQGLKADLESRYSILNSQFSILKKELQFSGPYDDHEVIINIYAGAGGTDAQDWAQMLERMYLRWAESLKLKAKVVEESAGEEAGIKSATLEITGGSYLYGKLAGEHGVHRLVRKSPFNSAGSRETSFAKVEVLPLIDKPEEVGLDEKDLKIDVYRAGGHGGQSVNTTDSAVRVTHLPTGLSVAIQNERSQLQNKETALNILRSRLAQLQLEQHAETLADIKGPSQSNEFGSQIRNYILDDRIVKDLRTGYESHDPQKVLDGDLEPLINLWLDQAATV